ncbi:hypothetical protein ACFSTC_02900 [Nonomuraea ferruginea]
MGRLASPRSPPSIPPPYGCCCSTPRAVPAGLGPTVATSPWPTCPPPVVGPAVEVTRAGLTGTDGKPDVLNNFDVAYDPSRDRFYAVREQHPYPTVAPKQIGASLQVASIDGASIWNGGGSWRVEGVIDPALTGLPRNHNAGIVRTVYGTLPDSGSLTVIFTESCAGTCASLWSYDLWRVTGTLT